MTTGPDPEPRDDPTYLADRCAEMRAKYGNDAVVIAGAAVWEQIARDAAAFRALTDPQNGPDA